jgi:ribosome biogenesis GTPase A
MKYVNKSEINSQQKQTLVNVQSYQLHSTFQVLVLNKVDLVPTWVTQKWVALLSSEFPTIAFHASIKHPFGKGALINLLRQFSKLHKDSKQVC